ncbi:Allergen Asp f 15 [Grifola frondosa]|uniref:Allergen Asp f 15 n=1 Tax=Grifola frondosa TaxID=5627 RepID=M5A7A3_GRIFR|nr:Allergen Asp f 15 [Grifola frondosa]BAN04648.1 cerato-platanin-like protein 2 [Grifola frondosa]
MQFKTLLFSTVALFLSTAFAQTTVSVSYDQTYDTASTSLAEVACSDGPNGLLSKGFTTFGSLPDFPFIGGAQAVAGFDSPNCGTCWTLSFNGNSIHVLAIDTTANGFNIALEAMNVLTDNQGVFLGRVNATAEQTTAATCGL